MSSRVDTLYYALNSLEKEIVRVIRTMTWMPLDDLVDTVQSVIPHNKRSTVSRVLQYSEISKVPQAKRAIGRIFEVMGEVVPLVPPGLDDDGVL